MSHFFFSSNNNIKEINNFIVGLYLYMKIIPACITLVFVIIDTQALQRITFFVLFCFVLSNLKESQVSQHEKTDTSWLIIP